MADNEFQLLHCIAKEELMVPNRRIRPEKILPDHSRSQSSFSLEELLEMETEPVDDDLRDLLKRLLIKDPSQRITLKEVKRHPWVLYGIKDPCAWVDETDPERMSDGNRIEVTVEDVEKAVSSAGVLNRARSAMKKAGAWYRGLRKRASSAADVASRDGKDKKTERKWEPQDAAQHLQGYYHFGGDDDKELQWMGGVSQWNEDRRPSVATLPTHSSATSTDTVQHLVSHDNSRSGPPTPNLRASPVHHLPEAERYMLRKRPSVSFLGSPRRHRTLGSESSSVHRSPSTCSTSRFGEIKGENAPAVASPQHGNGGLFRDGMKRIVGRMRSGNLSSDNGKDPISREGSPLRARDALAGNLRSGDHSFYAYGAGSLQVQVPPHRRHSYTCEQIEASVPLDRTPRFSPGGMASMLERASIGRSEEARRKLGALEIDSNIEQPCPPSPDDSVSMEKIWGREQQKRLLQLEERQKYSQPSLCVTPGWTKENYYFPARDSPTPPITIDGRARSGFFDDQSIPPPVLPHHRDSEGQLASSSSEEQFATTAGSSLTNSTSFPSVPSVLSESSSISSDFYGRYSRKSSIAGLVEEEALNDNGEYEYQRKDRPGTPYRENTNSYPNIDEADEIAQCDDGGDEGEESDGGFVLKIKPRSESVAGELIRRPLGAVEAPPQRTRRRSRSSSGTVKEGKEKRNSRGRTKGKTVAAE